MTVVGLVIAGGRSSRFGSEKALARWQGRSLLEHAVARLQRSCEAVAVNARPGTQTADAARLAGWAVLHDLPGDASGPLAGVRAGLAWAEARGASHLLVSPCDTPRLPDALPNRLRVAAGKGGAFAVTDGGPQPLCACWPVAWRLALEAALQDGAHPSVWRLMDALGATRVPFEDAEAFANVNTPAELAALAHQG